MTQDQKIEAILFIRPNAEFTFHGEELEWLDKKQDEPNEEEIAQAWIDYEAKKVADKIQADAKRQELLNKLGITAEEAKLLLS